MSITMIGLDTAKSVFQVHAVDEDGNPEIRRKLRRNEPIKFFEKQEACTVMLEACGAAHHWARMLAALGHDVKLIAPEAVEPFVKKGKKNDAADAAALCAAASRPDIKFVPAKTLGTAGHLGFAFGPIPLGQAADDASERHAWLGDRVRPHGSPGHRQVGGVHGVRRCGRVCPGASTAGDQGITGTLQRARWKPQDI